MKKFFRFYFPLLIVIAAVGFFTLRYLVENHENVVKCLVGFGKIISPAKNAVIKINDVEATDTKIFEKDGRFYFVTDSFKSSGADLFIIDKARNDIALTNSGCREVLFSNYLFLADCGYGGIFYSTEKADNFNTQLKITDSEINFVLPYGKVEILFKGE